MMILRSIFKLLLLFSISHLCFVEARSRGSRGSTLVSPRRNHRDLKVYGKGGVPVDETSLDDPLPATGGSKGSGTGNNEDTGNTGNSNIENENDGSGNDNSNSDGNGGNIGNGSSIVNPVNPGTTNSPPTESSSNARALSPFSIAVKGNDQGPQDIVEVIELFLYSKLSESFESLEWILLSIASADSNRRLETNVHSFSGSAIFLGSDIPTEEEVQEAQRKALQDMTILEEFLSEQGHDWKIIFESFNEADNTDGQTTSSETDPAVATLASVLDNTNDEKKKGNGGVLVTCLVLIAMIALLAVGFVYRRKTLDSVKAGSISQSSTIGPVSDSVALEGLESDGDGEEVEMQREGVDEIKGSDSEFVGAVTTVELNSSTEAQNISNFGGFGFGGWDSIFRLSDKAASELEKRIIKSPIAEDNDKDPKAGKEKALHLVPEIEETEKVVPRSRQQQQQQQTKQEEVEDEESDSVALEELESDGDGEEVEMQRGGVDEIKWSESEFVGAVTTVELNFNIALEDEAMMPDLENSLSDGHCVLVDNDELLDQSANLAIQC